MSARTKSSEPDPVFVLRSGTESVSALKFCLFGLGKEEVLVSGTQNGVVQVWDLQTKRAKLKFQASQHDGILQTDIVEINKQQYIISHDRKGKVNFWQVIGDDVMLKQQLSVHNIGFCPVHIYNGEKDYWLAYPSSSDSEISITKLDLNEDSIKYSVKPEHKLGMVMHIRLFSRGTKLYAIVGYEDGSICTCDMFARALLHLKKIHNDPVMCLDVDTRAVKLISGSADNTLRVLRIDEDVHLQESYSNETATSGFSSVSIRNDGKLVVCGGWDGKLRVFGWKKLKPLAILKYHNEGINSICFSRENLVAAGSKDGKISLWDVYKNT